MTKYFKDPVFINVYLNVVHIEDFFDRFTIAKSLNDFRKIAKRLEGSSDCTPVDIEYSTPKDDDEFIKVVIETEGYKFEHINTMMSFRYSCSYSEKNGYVCKERGYIFQVNSKLYNLIDGFEAVMADPQKQQYSN
jgi:hypothetical protein